MPEMCPIQELCPSSLGSLPHVPAMLLLECQWGWCHESKGGVHTWDLEHHPGIHCEIYEVTFANQFHLQLDPNLTQERHNICSLHDNHTERMMVEIGPFPERRDAHFPN